MSRLHGEKHHIVVVDDSPDFCALLRDFLTSAGYEVALFTSAREALERIEKTKTDLVICDLNMPEINGIQLLKEVHGRGIPFLLVTAYGSADVQKEALKNGASGFLQKPFPLSKLTALAEKLLRD